MSALTGLPSSAPAYRPEIDGLRALAVIPVILFHAGFQTFSGGYVGVDVFFVISGYLITSIILTEIEQGKFELVRFYERRARRILPALFFVAAVCVPFALLWLMERDMRDFSESLVSVATFSSNFLFWQESGYFATEAELKPLLHTWSLAVEEQYYILFPLFLMAMWRFGRGLIVAALVVVALVSLGLAHWGAYNAPDAAFYLLITRGWEILAGALVAFYLHRRERRGDSGLLSLLGLCLIAIAVFTFDEQTPFPGLFGLVPVAGAVLIILFTQPDTAVYRLLSTKTLVAVGLVSYSAYLWHQPLFAFTRYRSINEPSALAMALLCLISILLAFLTWHYIEKPFRRRTGRFNRRSLFQLSAGATTAVVAIGIAGAQYTSTLHSLNAEQQMLVDTSKANQLRESCDESYTGNGFGIDFCQVGNLSMPPTVAVFGDSHSEALLPAFDQAAKRLNIGVVHLGLDGCPPLYGLDVALGNFRPGACEELSEKQLRYLEENDIQKVFLIARWALYTDGDYEGKHDFYLVQDDSDSLTVEKSRENFTEALRTTISKYGQAGAQIYVVEQIPHQKVDPYRAIAFTRFRAFSDVLQLTSVPREQHEGLQQFNRTAIEKIVADTPAQLISFDEMFCDARRCRIGTEKALYYLDQDHISDYGAKALSYKISGVLK